VVTVHDLVIYEDGLVDSRFAEQGRAKIELMLRGHRPDAIIAISRFTRDSIVRQFPDLAPITHVVPLGVDNAKVATAAPPDDMPWGDAPYLLYVGSVELRKNLERIVAAFEIAKESAPDLRLVIVGSNGHGGGEIDARIESSPRRSSIHKLGFVPDGTLAALYRGAALFIYPSLYEGFGLPILEAMKNGVPVITSNFGAMAEVAADAALLADSYDPEAIAEAITTLLDDQSKRTALVEAGRRRVLEFTWERCAAETVQVYERIKNSK
jgi:glycosyltransferase involved in cell wall biosynthesis